MWLFLRLWYTYELDWFENDVSERLAVREMPFLLPHDIYGLFYIAILKQKLLEISCYVKDHKLIWDMEVSDQKEFFRMEWLS